MSWGNLKELSDEFLSSRNESNSSSTIIAATAAGATTTLNTSSGNDDTLPSSPARVHEVSEGKQIPIHSPATNPPINIVPDTPENNNSICRRSSDSDLSVTPKGEWKRLIEGVNEQKMKKKKKWSILLISSSNSILNEIICATKSHGKAKE